MQHSIAARYAAWPARFVHPSRQGARAASRSRPVAGVHRRARAPDRAAPAGRRPADGAPRAVARAHDRAGARQRGAAGPSRPSAMRWTSSHPVGRIAPLLRGARVARLRQASATSAGGIVIRFTDGTPELVVGKRRRERDGVTWTLPEGHARCRTRRPSRRPSARCARRPGSRSGSSAPLDFIEYCVRPGRHADPQDRPLLPHGARPAATSSRHDHEFAEVRWIAFAEAATLLTFDTERALVARAAAEADRRLVPGARLSEATRR